jgi:hypothetical protein
VNSKIQIPKVCPSVFALTGTENVEPPSWGKWGIVATMPADTKLPCEGCIVINSDDAPEVATTDPAYLTWTATVAVWSADVENHDAKMLAEQVPTPLAACNAPQVAL